MRTRLVLGIALLGVAAAGAVAALTEEWGYGELKGPDSWCELDASYALCCEGSKQSPVDIPAADTIEDQLPKLNFKYKKASFTAYHNGETIRADVPGGKGALKVGGQNYTLMQFHFHTPSEHRIDGVAWPAEMHLVHGAQDGSTLVVGAPLEIGASNKELQKIWFDLPQEDGDEVSVQGFHLERLIPNGHDSYRYEGSLTTPPCSEGVS